MFHRFAELGPAPCLVRSTDFEYDEGHVVTYLKSATQAGYIRQRNQAGNFTGQYTRAYLPSLDFGYVTPGVGINFSEKSSLYTGYSIGNEGRGNNFLGVYYGYNF